MTLPRWLALLERLSKMGCVLGKSVNTLENSCQLILLKIRSCFYHLKNPASSYDLLGSFIRSGPSNHIEDDDAPLIRQIFPQADISTLAEAAHWLHNAPEEFS